MKTSPDVHLAGDIDLDPHEISGSEEILVEDWTEDEVGLVARKATTPADVEGWPPSPGTVLLGKYVVEHVLGRGGMGVVVVAQHRQLHQRVAIKFLHPAAMKNADVVARFAREARVLASIQSEHVVRFLDVGTLERGEPYMIMECLEGTDLSRLVKRRGPLPIEEAVEYILQACEPLAEAHAAGIVHRDLKPSNLYLARRADAHIIKVIDFGISKLMARDVEDEGSLTTTSVVLGSPLYMSPEQLRSSKEIDARVDIWALGVILHKLLTGKTPWMADTLAQLCAAILLQAPPKVTEIRPSVPLALEAVILKCMEKDPDNRYQNVAELAQALSPFSIAPQSSAAVLRTLRLLRALSTTRASTVRAQAPTACPKRPFVYAALLARIADAASTFHDTWQSSLFLPFYRKRRASIAMAAAGLALGIGLVALVTWPRHEPARAQAAAAPIACAAPLPVSTPLPVVAAAPPVSTGNTANTASTTSTTSTTNAPSTANAANAANAANTLTAANAAPLEPTATASVKALVVAPVRAPLPSASSKPVLKMDTSQFGDRK